VILFIEGIIEPLKGWVKDFRPPTLSDSIKKTHDMADTTVRKAPLKTFIPQKGHATKFPQQTWTRKDRLNKFTDLMRNVTSKQELWPKKPIFLHKKHQNQSSNQKVVLPVAPFF
jgi:hypothetical protein